MFLEKINIFFKLSLFDYRRKSLDCNDIHSFGSQFIVALINEKRTFFQIFIDTGSRSAIIAKVITKVMDIRILWRPDFGRRPTRKIQEVETLTQIEETIHAGSETILHSLGLRPLSLYG